jgi:peroxisome-assembly ATPase
VEDAKGEGIGESREVDEKQDEALVRHGASPVRTHAELLPKINWTHVWGTVKWGKGEEGLEIRKKRRV